MIKKCSKCKIEKQIKEFSVKDKAKNRYNSQCKKCFNVHNRVYYAINKIKHIAAVKINKHNRAEKNKKIIREYKNIPCMDCGNSYPHYVMDFDHRDPEVKEFAISQMPRDCSLEKILNEIKKCDVVCANCHRVRTFRDYSK